MTRNIEMVTRIAGAENVTTKKERKKPRALNHKWTQFALAYLEKQSRLPKRCEFVL